MSYAQVVRTVNDQAGEGDVCLAAAGGFPGEVNNGWWTKGIATFDCEYGYSCMAHAAAMGAGAETISSLDELGEALGRARASDRTYVIAMKVDAYTWTEGGSFWEVGVPEVSNMQSVVDARAEMDKGKAEQRIGW